MTQTNSNSVFSSNFCMAPWTNIDISPQGNITPCCKFTMPAGTEWENEVLINSNTVALSEFWQYTNAKDAFRKQSFKDTFPELYELMRSKDHA